MEMRPELSKDMDGQTFRSFYYLKEELVAFCRNQGLPTAGGKIELTDRIAHYLDTGEAVAAKSLSRSTARTGVIAPSSAIEPNFVCTEQHRAFFLQHIGPGFHFNVPFQKWLKANPGKTYEQAIEAYFKIQEERKQGGSEIDRQFEYNTYVRDFFQDNEGKTLRQAILCWNYKKSLPGHNRYEFSDLSAL